MPPDESCQYVGCCVVLQYGIFILAMHEERPRLAPPCSMGFAVRKIPPSGDGGPGNEPTIMTNQHKGASKLMQYSIPPIDI